MQNISVYIGNKIQFYRRLNNMTLTELAERIHKGKSTVSKYEKGLITIDVETLQDLADAFHINICQFLDYEDEEMNRGELAPLSSCFKKGFSYIYYYDGRKKKVVHSYLKILPKKDKDLTYPCSLYMDFSSLSNYEDCDFFYMGEMQPFDLVSYATVINQANPMERLGLCVLNSLHNNAATWGLMFGISYKPIAPFARKILVSSQIIPDKSLTKEELTLSSSELKMMKNMNMMLLNQ